MPACPILCPRLHWLLDLDRLFDSDVLCEPSRRHGPSVFCSVFLPVRRNVGVVAGIERTTMLSVFLEHRISPASSRCLRAETSLLFFVCLSFLQSGRCFVTVCDLSSVSLTVWAHKLVFVQARSTVTQTNQKTMKSNARNKAKHSKNEKKKNKASYLLIFVEGEECFSSVEIHTCCRQ